jgi:enoyl-CoA hydratase/carnithine racemase
MPQDSVELASCQTLDRVALITLANERSRNALSLAMIETLTTFFIQLAARRDIHVIVLQAEGPVFCAGHDLRELTAHRNDEDGGHAFFTQTMTACSMLMQHIIGAPQPVIAAVDGMATAAGCQLVATCDLAIAGPDARFCTPGVNIGLFCSTPSVALARGIGRKQALEMLLTGDVFGVEDALRFGLVNRLAPDGARAAALALARQISDKSPHALMIGKETFYRQVDMPLAAAYDHASAVMVENMMIADACEGISAFLEKRPPIWPKA